MNPPIKIRPITRQDRADWRPLWDGYNAFCGRGDLLGRAGRRDSRSHFV